MHTIDYDYIYDFSPEERVRRARERLFDELNWLETEFLLFGGSDVTLTELFAYDINQARDEILALLRRVWASESMRMTAMCVVEAVRVLAQVVYGPREDFLPLALRDRVRVSVN